MKRIVWIVVLLALAAGGFFWWRKSHADQQAQAQKGAGERTVPVIAAEVEKKDVPIYLDGLGTVTAYKTVTIRTQVDGRLDTVNFKEGQAVHKGDVLAQIDPRPFEIQLKQAQGALARDSSLLKAAKLNLERNKELLSRKLIAPQTVDDQAAQSGQYEGAVQIDEAAVASARLNLSYARIVAPMDGVTGIRAVDPGNFVRASDASGLLVLAQLDPVAVIFTLPQDVLQQIAAAQKGGALQVDVFSRDGGDNLGTGRLELIDNQINATTATLRLKAVLPNADRKLWPNQFVKARLRVSVRKDALVMPASAVQRGPDGSFAWVVQQDQTAVSKPLQLDRQQGDVALIAQGLQQGEVVITDGVSGLKPGSKVQVQKAGQKPAGGKPRPEGGKRPEGRDPGAQQR